MIEAILAPALAIVFMIGVYCGMKLEKAIERKAKEEADKIYDIVVDSLKRQGKLIDSLKRQDKL